MQVLVVGSGGREHTLVWKFNNSENVDKVYCAPGNAGTEIYGKNIDIDDTDVEGLLEFAQEKKIDLTVVGPEAPLLAGIVDEFEEAGLNIFGPTKAASMLECSKVFAKKFMKDNDIPTSDFTVVETQTELEKVVHEKEFPYVIKVDGLAAGKGAFVIQDREDLTRAINEIFEEEKFGEAADQVLIEEFIEGEELSVFALTDGDDYVLLSPAQDHKPAYEGGKGPNTGGMGAFAPAPLGTQDILKKAEEQVIKPTLEGMKQRGTPYKGVLYCGLMINNDEPQVLEFNARFGDPEAQITIPLVEEGFLETVDSIARGELNQTDFKLSDEFATCVVMASGGYPIDYETGKEIKGLDELESENGMVFLAGATSKNGKLLTDGGRVLSVVNFGETLQDSIQKAYQRVETIDFEDVHYREDIGQKGLNTDKK